MKNKELIFLLPRLSKYWRLLMGELKLLDRTWAGEFLLRRLPSGLVWLGLHGQSGWIGAIGWFVLGNV